VGLIKIKLFRPFPYEVVSELLKGLNNVAVLDKAISSGSKPALYSEIVNTAYNNELKTKINSYVYGLGGRDIFIKDIEGIFNELLENKFSKEVKYIK
jgi:pyruvate ferredoxin oxidoreductase alpha subunit